VAFVLSIALLARGIAALVGGSIISATVRAAEFPNADIRAKIRTPIDARRLNADAAVHAPSPMGHIQYAEQFLGATWDVKVKAALAAACPTTAPNAVPPVNGIVDARALIGNQKLAVTMRIPPNCTLLIGRGVFTLAPRAQILYDSGSRIIGSGMGFLLQRGTQITDTNGDKTPMLAYVSGTSGSGAYNPELAEFSLYGAGHNGVGLNLIHTTDADVHDVSMAGGLEIGVQLGFPGGCDCYNSFTQVWASGASYGAKFNGYSNQNQWFGGGMNGGRRSGVGLYVAGSMDNFYSPDFENDHIAVEFAGGAPHGGSTLYSAYFEGNGINVLFDPRTYGNAVIGGSLASSVSDTSGNDTNFVFTTGSSATAGAGVTPRAFGARQLNIGGNLTDNGTAHLTAGSGVDHGVDLDWSDNRTRTYGREGGANFHAGALYSVGGANLNGTIIGPLPNPIAPSISGHGSAGTTMHSYYVVCHTLTGYVTLPSLAGSISTSKQRLSSTEYNTITYSCGPGFNGADILRDGTSGNVLLAGCTNTGPNGAIKDIGQVPRSYSPPARNSTGDMRVAGMTISEGIRWPLPSEVINGASFYCPNCDTATSPPGVCLSRNTRTGSWVHGLTNRWICTP